MHKPIDDRINFYFKWWICISNIRFISGGIIILMKSKKGHVLLHVLLLMVITINILTFTLRLYLMEKMYYYNKNKKNQIYLLAERAKRHILQFLTHESVPNFYSEYLYYGQFYIYIYYKYEYSGYYWDVNVTIYYEEIIKQNTYYYYPETQDLQSYKNWYLEGHIWSYF